MEYRQLGNTSITVSKICLGSMTWGFQNTEKEAHEQLDYALAQGINFIDTAEMYAVPPSEKTYGLTEEYIGSYFQKHREKRKENHPCNKDRRSWNGLCAEWRRIHAAPEH